MNLLDIPLWIYCLFGIIALHMPGTILALFALGYAMDARRKVKRAEATADAALREDANTFNQLSEHIDGLRENLARCVRWPWRAQ